MKILSRIRERFRKDAPSPELLAFRENAGTLMSLDASGRRLIRSWLELERSARAVREVIERLRSGGASSDVLEHIAAWLRPACVNRAIVRLFEKPGYIGGFVGLARNPEVDDRLAVHLARKAVREMRRLIRAGTRHEDGVAIRRIASLKFALDFLFSRRAVVQRVSVMPIATALLRKRGSMDYDTVADIAGALFMWAPLRETEYIALYELIMAGDGCRHHLPSVRALLRVAQGRHTPLTVIRRLLAEAPPSIQKNPLVLEVLKPHAGHIPDYRNRILALDRAKAIDNLARNLSASDRVLAIRRIRELGDWPSAELVRSADVRFFDQGLFMDLLACPDMEVRMFLISHLNALSRERHSKPMSRDVRVSLGDAPTPSPREASSQTVRR